MILFPLRFRTFFYFLTKSIFICVSSWHHYSTVTLLNLRTEFKTKFSILESIHSDIFFTLNCHISLTVKAFDLVPTLRDRPQYQQSFCWIAALAAVQWLNATFQWLKRCAHRPMWGIGTDHVISGPKKKNKTYKHSHVATTRLTRPRGLSQWKKWKYI